MRALLLLVLALIAGCDNPAVLANIDTLTCAYLPSSVDCTTQEVHDKAVGMLTHGIVEAQIECSPACVFTSVVFPASQTSGFTYRAQKLIDGSCLTTKSFTGAFLASRTDPEAPTCRQSGGGASMEASDGELIFHNGPGAANEWRAPIETCCTGFNLEAFGVE